MSLAQNQASAETQVAVKQKEKNKETMYKVRDINAKVRPRTHRLPVDGEETDFTFPNDVTFIEVPKSAAQILVGVEGFIVHNENGIPLRNMSGTVLKDGLTLQYNQVVATYDELTFEALLTRAKVYPECDLDKRDGKEKAIAFLLEKVAEEQEAAMNKKMKVITAGVISL